jgi:hypothetical protein
LPSIETSRVGKLGDKLELLEGERSSRRLATYLESPRSCWPSTPWAFLNFFTLTLNLCFLIWDYWCIWQWLVSSSLDWGLGLCALAHDDVLMISLEYAWWIRFWICSMIKCSFVWCLFMNLINSQACVKLNLLGFYVNYILS